jgi:putative phosphoesterase
MASTLTQTIQVDARRIGLLSDTHTMAADGSDLPAELFTAFTDVDLIVHLGHIQCTGTLDRLGQVAPVLAVQTPLDDKLFGEALAAELESGRTAGVTRIVEAGGLRIGLVHNFSAGDVEVPISEDGQVSFPDVPMDELLTARFGAPVDVVAFANTHTEIVAYRQGVLLVNPGSPNLPGGARKGGLGTVAILTVQDGAAAVEIVDLARA